GPPDDLRMTVWGDAEAGPLFVRGAFPGDGPLIVEAESTELRLDDLVRGAPPIELSGEVTMQIDPSDPTPRVTITTAPTVYEVLALPALTVTGRLHDDYFEIEELSAPYAGGDLQVEGTVDFEGRTEIRVRGSIPQIAADPNIRSLVPGARGALSGDVELAMGPVGNSNVDLRGTVTFRNFRYGPVTARFLRATGSIRGNLSRPVVNGHIDAEELAVGGYMLGQSSVDVSGGPGSYIGGGDFVTAGRRLEVDVTADSVAGGMDLALPRIAYDIDGVRWNGSARDIGVYRSGLSVGSLQLAGSGGRVQGALQYRYAGEEDIRLEMQDFDLRVLRSLFGEDAPDVGGLFTGALALSGDVERPNIQVEGSIVGGRYRELEGVDGFFTGGYQEGNLVADAQVTLGEHGSLIFTGDGLVDPSIPDPLVALENGLYDVQAQLTEVDVVVLEELAFVDELPFDGALTGEIAFEGPIFAPTLEAALSMRSLQIPEWPELRVDGTLSYENGVTVARVVTLDDRGELFEAEGNLVIDLYQLIENPDIGLATLETLPWRMSTRIPYRRVRDMPQPIYELIPEPLHPLGVSVSGTLAGGALTTRGDIYINADWEGDALDDAFCGQRLNPRVEARINLDGIDASAEVRAFSGQSRILGLQATAEVPLEDWISQRKRVQVPEIALLARVDEAEAQRLPFVCDLMTGPLSAELEMSAFGSAPAARLAVRSPGVVIGTAQPMEANLMVDVDAETATLDGTLAWWSGEAADLYGTLPVTWDESNTLVRIADDRPVEFVAGLSNAPIGKFLAWLPQVNEAYGYADGRVEARGTIEDLDLRGGISLREGYLELEGLGQHLTDITGELELNGNWVGVRRFEAYDGEGSTRVDGRVEFAGYRPAGVQLAIQGESFPVRNEGSVLARLTGVASLNGQIEPEATELDITVQRLEVQLPAQASRSTQSLQLHPDIRIVGQEEEETEIAESYPFRFHIDSQEPFWVRRSDFAAQVSTDLTALYQSPYLRVTGYVNIQRGYYEVFGKRFAIERGTMNFDGGNELDPVLNVVVTHSVEAPANATVTVTVTGRLSSPDIEFASDHANCIDRAQIVSMLLSGRCGNGRVSGTDAAAFDEQTVDFLGGLLAGVGTIFLRDQFGDFLPDIVFEQTAYGGRVRLGFNANAVIPEFLRPIVRGAYVQGLLTTASNDDGGDSSTELLPGAQIELQFPYNLVGTGRVNYNGSNVGWGVDFTWEP
ncbi:MAG: translocation/assembly module TamB domain-containing protein, partial [Myxococcota bacterium]